MKLLGDCRHTPACMHARTHARTHAHCSVSLYSRALPDKRMRRWQPLFLKTHTRTHGCQHKIPQRERVSKWQMMHVLPNRLNLAGGRASDAHAASTCTYSGANFGMSMQEPLLEMSVRISGRCDFSSSSGVSHNQPQPSLPSQSIGPKIRQGIVSCWLMQNPLNGAHRQRWWSGDSCSKPGKWSLWQPSDV